MGRKNKSRYQQVTEKSQHVGNHVRTLRTSTQRDCSQFELQYWCLWTAKYTKSPTPGATLTRVQTPSYTLLLRVLLVIYRVLYLGEVSLKQLKPPVLFLFYLEPVSLLGMCRCADCN